MWPNDGGGGSGVRSSSGMNLDCMGLIRGSSRKSGSHPAQSASHPAQSASHPAQSGGHPGLSGNIRASEPGLNRGSSLEVDYKPPDGKIAQMNRGSSVAHPGSRTGEM